MAKRSARIFAKKNHGMKHCRVILERLSRAAIESFLNPTHIITHNISAKIVDNVLKINNCEIKPTDFNFNLKLKVTQTGISVVQSKPHVHSQAVSKLNEKPISKLVDDAWRMSKSNHKENKFEIQTNDIVMAKLKGHPVWPAIVVEFVSKNKTKVEFFGADIHEKFGFVTTSEMTLFKNSAHLVLLSSKRNIAKLTKGIREAEISCGIPAVGSIISSKS